MALHEMSDKRVACLYRVSTAKQLDDNDIPMQQNACRRFISKRESWSLVNEYVEKGVSGYKVAISDRDVIQNIMQDASKGLFDILLLFCSDRLCRKADEYTPAMEKLSKLVEVWTVVKGDITIRNHTDALNTYVEGLQNEGESFKLSFRADEKHKQMIEHGEYRGGTPPFGYKLELSGKYNTRDVKQRKELYSLVIDNEEAKVVSSIYNLVYEVGWGGSRIARYLNSPEVNIPSRSGGQWSMPTVNYILRNPIYKGYPAYGKNSRKTGKQFRQNEDQWVMSEKKIQELAIIPEEIWNRVSVIRKSRTPIMIGETANYHYTAPTKGNLLLVGFIHCGSCGSALVTSHHNKGWTNKDGTKRTKTTLKYECAGKKAGRSCSGGRIYARDRIEEPVIEYVKDFLSQLKKQDLTDDFERNRKFEIKRKKDQLVILLKEKENKYREIEALQDEIPKTLTGQSPFTKEQLADLVKHRNKEIENIRTQALEVEAIIKAEQVEVDDIVTLQKALPKWEGIFDKASEEKKKMMLASIIEDVTIYSGRFEVKIKLHIQQFIDSIVGVT